MTNSKAIKEIANINGWSLLEPTYNPQAAAQKKVIAVYSVKFS